MIQFHVTGKPYASAQAQVKYLSELLRLKNDEIKTLRRQLLSQKLARVNEINETVEALTQLKNLEERIRGKDLPASQKPVKKRRFWLF